jgi:replicative DNA helicase
MIRAMTDNPRLQPQNLEAEQSVLGAILIDNRALTQAKGLLLPDDFYKTQNGRIYQAMMELSEHGEIIDQITLTEHLRSHGALKAVGGSAYLAELILGIVSAANIADHSEIVRDHSIRCRVINGLVELTGTAYDGADLSTITARLQAIQLVFPPGAVGCDTKAFWA